MFIPTGENFKLTQWPFLNYFVYFVGSNQVKNWNSYTLEGWYIKTDIEKIV